MREISHGAGEKVLINMSWPSRAGRGRCSMSQTDRQSWDLGRFQAAGSSQADGWRET